LAENSFKIALILIYWCTMSICLFFYRKASNVVNIDKIQQCGDSVSPTTTNTASILYTILLSAMLTIKTRFYYYYFFILGKFLAWILKTSHSIVHLGFALFHQSLLGSTNVQNFLLMPVILFFSNGDNNGICCFEQKNHSMTFSFVTNLLN